MSKVSVFDSGWIDLVFEGRNKSYGAYQLRRDDSKTTLIALFSGIALIAVLVSIPIISNYLKADVAITYTPVDPLIIHDIEFPAVEPPKPETVQPKADAAPANPEPTVHYTKLEPTSGPLPADPPTTTQVQTTNAGTTDDPGTGAGFTTGPTSADGPPEGTGTATTTLTGNDIVLPGSLDKMPAFPGGIEKFYKYVGNNFRTPETANEMTLRVYVSFVIEKDGTMTAITVPRNTSDEMGKEAMRVLKSLRTKWIPGIKNGQPVRTAYNLPITINVK
jgi:protein TonB